VALSALVTSENLALLRCGICAELNFQTPRRETKMKANNAKLSSEDKARLGVLWVLLNVTTDIPATTDEVITVMDAIEKLDPNVPKMWDKKFKILINDKVVYEWYQD